MQIRWGPALCVCVCVCVAERYLFDLCLQLLVKIPKVPHGELTLSPHHYPFHVDLIGQILILMLQVLTFLCDGE